jgi:hypothetical protein
VETAIKHPISFFSLFFQETSIINVSVPVLGWLGFEPETNGDITAQPLSFSSSSQRGPL